MCVVEESIGFFLHIILNGFSSSEPKAPGSL